MRPLAIGLAAVLVAAAAGWAVWSATGPRITDVHPGTGDVPANFLRLYIDFSEPMGGDDAFEHLRLLDSSGRAMVEPFREIELWSRNHTRLMVYIHPGRVKTGLAMNGEFGPVLVEGKRYTFEVLPGMKSLRGRPLKTGFRRELRVGPPIAHRLDFARWRLDARPERLEIDLDDWMDQAGLEDWVQVPGVQGRWEIIGRKLIFIPQNPFAPGTYSLVVDARLEDVCGNSFQRAFETRPDAPAPESLPQTVTRTFTISP